MASVNGGNGSLSWGIVPLNWTTTNLATMSYGYRSNYLKSANDQLRYQIQWFYNGNNEGTEPVNEGDLVNVIFKVETSVDSTNWKTIGTIKKSRDIANRRYETGLVAGGHRFTIDVSQLVSDELSYSLCPINKGTWQNNYYGGMNGGLTMQDNVIGSNSPSGFPISNYNVTENGTFRRLRVSATFEVLDANNQIVTASNSISEAKKITVINSVNQFEKDSSYYYNDFNISDSDSNRYRFLSRCPNWTDLSPLTYDFQKEVRVDEQAEFLQFYIRKSSHRNINVDGSESRDALGAIGLRVETFLADGSAENSFYLRDFEDNLITSVNDVGSKFIAEYQNQMCIQNVSPYYINNTAALKASTTSRVTFPYWSAYTGNKITASTAYYRVSMSKFGMYADYSEKRATKYSYYTIDREDDKIPYDFVRFHWLNSVGGIDSYTAKRDVVEGLTINRSVIERKSSDRTWYQDDTGTDGGTAFAVPNDLYISDTMRGGDIYKGGREVSGVNADRVQSIYTEPLNKSVAKWLEEMLLSPNVWVEMDTEATQRGKSVNPYLRPSDKEYIPIIITNSDAETVNQAEGLVKFNIEYTLAHKVITQRN